MPSMVSGNARGQWPNRTRGGRGRGLSAIQSSVDVNRCESCGNPPTMMIPPATRSSSSKLKALSFTEAELVMIVALSGLGVVAFAATRSLAESNARLRLVDAHAILRELRSH